MGKSKGNDDGDSSSPSSSESGSESSQDRGRERNKSRKKDKSDKKKSKKSHKDKSHKKHKRHKDKDKEDDLLKKAKAFLKQQLEGGTASVPAPAAAAFMPAPPSHPRQQVAESQKITDDDYFQKSNEFMTWLQEQKGLLFNELSAEDSRSLFSVFVEHWNDGRLAPKYYAGLVQAPLRRTAHQWAFAKKSGASGASGAGGGMAAFLDDERMRQSERRDADRLDRKRRAADERLLIDEILPKATGRDALAEKRVARREEAKARDASPDRAFLPGGGGDLMGGDDSFAAAKAREARRAEFQRSKQLVKREEVMQKLAVEQAKEDEKMAQFRALLNQGPITIAKRQ